MFPKGAPATWMDVLMCNVSTSCSFAFWDVRKVCHVAAFMDLWATGWCWYLHVTPSVYWWSLTYADPSAYTHIINAPDADIYLEKSFFPFILSLFDTMHLYFLAFSFAVSDCKCPHTEQDTQTMLFTLLTFQLIPDLDLMSSLNAENWLNKEQTWHEKVFPN